MNFRKRIPIRLLLAGGAGFLMLALIFGLRSTLVLEVWDTEAKQLLLALPVKKGDSFSLQYTHSTAKTIIEEHFQIRGRDDILATRMIYVSGGAGIPDVAPPGAHFRINDDGRFVMDNLNKVFPLLANIRVAYFYPHQLIYHGNNYSLSKIARGRLVDIKVHKKISWNLLGKN
jgi:hypothetical protein